MNAPSPMRAGDVMLVTGQSKSSQLLALSQKAIYRNAKSSHALLGLGDGTFIHSTTDGGVHLKFLLDELVEVEDHWRVIRLKAITEDDTDRLLCAGIKFLRQEYNKAFFLSESDSASFCSELVAKAFRDAGLNAFGDARPSAVTPAHLDRMADNASGWDDVTQSYREFLPAFTRDQAGYRLGFNTISHLLARRHVQSAGRAMILDLLVKTAPNERRAERQDFVEDQKRQLRENRALHFWDETDSHPSVGKPDDDPEP